MAAYAVMLLLMMAWQKPETCRVLEIKAKIQLHLGYIYTYLNTVHGNKNLKFITVACSWLKKCPQL
jgi:hypothetical protein